MILFFYGKTAYVVCRRTQSDLTTHNSQIHQSASRKKLTRVLFLVIGVFCVVHFCYAVTMYFIKDMKGLIKLRIETIVTWIFEVSYFIPPHF